MYKVYRNIDGLEVQLPEYVFDKIKIQIIKYYPHECGGIFVGSIDENNTAIIKNMMMPRKFKSSPVFFLRVADFINKWLLRIFRQSEGRILYLGEWHSHPNGQPIPSTTDFNSMEKISLNENVRIRTPILLIVGYNSIRFKERFYIFYKQNLIPYESC